MLTVSQRLVGLFILYEIYLHANVKTTPFYQIMLDLLTRKNSIHPAERKLLLSLVKSVPKISKLTPKQYIEMTNKEEEKNEEVDLEPHKKAHTENMPSIPLLNSASIVSVVDDFKKKQQILNSVILDNDEIKPQELLPDLYCPIPSSDESYLLQSVLSILQQ